MIACLVTIGALMAVMTLFFPVEGKTALKLRFVRGMIFLYGDIHAGLCPLGKVSCVGMGFGDSAIVYCHGRSQHGDDI